MIFFLYAELFYTIYSFKDNFNPVDWIFDFGTILVQGIILRKNSY